MLTNTSNSGA